VITVSDLVVSRGGREVLSGVSTTVEEGELVGLVGPNGAGKTTLLQTINGVVTPDAGVVSVAGHDVQDCATRTLSRLVATVPQAATVAFEFDVRDVVAMGRTPYQPRLGRRDHREDRRQVDRGLERTETAGLADRPVTDLSGGERQRVVLARALAQDTPVLLLDEPTASLDVDHQERTLSLVADLVADGKTALAAIHDLDLAARFCDRIVVLADGRVLASGPPAAVLTGEVVGEAFGTDAVVATDPVTGTPSVTALSERADRPPSVHVVASGPTGATATASLVDAGLAVSVGPVPEGDVVVETARTLDLPSVVVPPFETVDARSLDRARTLATEADVLVLAAPRVETAPLVTRLVDDRTPVVVAADAATGPEDATPLDGDLTGRPDEQVTVTDVATLVETVDSVAGTATVPADD
jgi:iron complex transport system ATP-binding protein